MTNSSKQANRLIHEKSPYLLQHAKITEYGAMDCLKALKRMDWDIQNAERYLCQKIDNPIIIGQIREIYEDDIYPSIKDLVNKPIKGKKFLNI